MAKIGVAREQGMISRIAGMLKDILIADTNDNNDAILAEVKNIEKEENSDRISFLMKLNSESQSGSKSNAVEKVKTKQVKMKTVNEKEGQDREIGD